MKLLNEIIEECISVGALFTVYDIIPEAEDRGCILSRDKISEYIKNYRYPIYYTRTIRDMGCEIIVPVYHPADVDASEYDATDLLPSTKSKNEAELPLKKINTDININKKAISDLNITIANRKKDLFDKRGRFHVKVSDVKKAGFEIGEKVKILINDNDGSIILTNKNKLKNTKQVGGVTVALYKTVSVAPRTFKMVCKDTPNELAIKSSKGQIKIVPVY